VQSVVVQHTGTFFVLVFSKKKKIHLMTIASTSDHAMQVTGISKLW